MRIFRYALGVVDHQLVDLPLSAIPLSVAAGQIAPGMPAAAEHIDLWALVPEEAPPVTYHFRIVGTGNAMPAALTRNGTAAAKTMFLGSCVMPSGLVWHVFVTAD